MSEVTISLEDLVENNLDIVLRLKTYIKYARGDIKFLEEKINYTIEKVKNRTMNRIKEKQKILEETIRKKIMSEQNIYQIK